MAKVLLGLGAALGWGLFSIAAAAQSGGANVRILDVSRALPHGALEENRINFADCLANDSIKLTVELQNYDGYALEVWAGVACDVTVNRPPSANATCWQVYSKQPDDVIQSIEFSVQDFLRGRTRAGVANDDTPPTAEAACEATSSVSSAQTLQAYVTLIDANNVVGAQASSRFAYRLNGSPPPEFSVSSGDGQLILNFTPGAIQLDAHFAGTQFFCDPPPGDPNATANATDAGSEDVMCRPSVELIGGSSAASLQHLRCGEAKADVTRGIADGLVNGVPYTVAVAAVDNFGNVGPLSPPQCEVPHAKPASDNRAEACSFTGLGSGRRGSALALLLALGATLARRSGAARRQRRVTW